MNKLVMALLVSFIGHIIAWFHMQGQFKFEWAKVGGGLLLVVYRLVFVFTMVLVGFMSTLETIGM